MARWWKASVLTLLALAIEGCLPITITLKDAETNRPLVAAHVKAEFDPFPFRHSPVCGVTGREGKVTLFCPNYPDGLQISKDGYAPLWFTLYKKRWCDGIAGTRRSSFTVYLYSEPVPEVVLSLPNSYRGAIMVREYAPHFVSGLSGRRSFEFHAKAGELTDIKGVPFSTGSALGYVCFSQAQYEDGTPLPILGTGPQDMGLGIRCVPWRIRSHTDYADVMYIVGTLQDFERLKNE
jgi:hypothetical protein